jgi:hypothetical protein
VATAGESGEVPVARRSDSVRDSHPAEAAAQSATATSPDSRSQSLPTAEAIHLSTE